ncbi:MAG: transcriptional regulator [Scytonema sp. PMC 1069.18]|nr:transcriptional regulator [Scytonema sp. PMC 1069.18]MEC4882229.1 transcriptional regulator [Scytonema sp. PMC 1070.18]
MPKTKSYHSFLIESLKDPNEAAVYLNTALEEQDLQLFLIALKNVAEVHGNINALLEKTNLHQENIYQMLSEAENQSLLYNLLSLLDTLGFKLAIAVKQ